MNKNTILLTNLFKADFKGIFNKIHEMIKDKTKIVIHYHSPCADGTASKIALLHTLYTRYNYSTDNIQFVPSGYGDLPHLEYDDDTALFIVDFSYRPLTLSQAVAGAVILIDHHETALIAFSETTVTFSDKFFIIIDDENSMSGAGMVWRIMHSYQDNIPDIIRCLEARDLWRKDVKYITEASMFAQEYTSTDDYSRWYKVLTSKKSFISEMVKFTPVVKNIDRTCRDLASKADIYLLSELVLNNKPTLKFDRKYTVGFVNCPPVFVSDTAEYVNVETDFVILFSFEFNGRVKISVRSLAELHVPLELTTMYGGGGHKSACGCIIEMQDFITLASNFTNAGPKSKSSVVSRIKNWFR